MADTDQAYTAKLASQLRCRHQVLLDSTENDLAELRGRMQTIARFLRNQAIALDIRQGLARDLHLPQPDR